LAEVLDEKVEPELLQEQTNQPELRPEEEKTGYDDVKENFDDFIKTEEEAFPVKKKNVRPKKQVRPKTEVSFSEEIVETRVKASPTENSASFFVTTAVETSAVETSVVDDSDMDENVPLKSRKRKSSGKAKAKFEALPETGVSLIRPFFSHSRRG